MLTIMAEIKVFEGSHHLQTVINAFQKVTALVLQEQGCHQYELNIDQITGLSFQNADPLSVIMLEKWESAEDLQAHMQTAHMQALQLELQDAVQSINIRILKSGF